MIEYTVTQSNAGHWTILRMDLEIAAGLTLGSAIAQARSAAKAEHLQLGSVTHVQMRSAESAIRLALFGDLDAATV